MFNVHLTENYPCKVLNDSSISDLYSLKNCIEKIEGISIYSASISQKLRIYKNKNEKIYMKMFITETPDIIKSLDKLKIKNENTGEYTKFNYKKNSLQDTVSNLLYEQYIYKNYINKLVDNNICPFFIRMIGGQNNVNSYTILNFLNNKLIDTKGNIIPNDIIKKILLRNTSLMLYRLGDMYTLPIIYNMEEISMSETSWNAYPKVLKEITMNECDHIRYGYTITESPNNAINFGDFLKKTLNVSRNKNSFKNKFLPIILYIIFQIILSCKILDICKINHNDLHFGNILVHKYNKTRNLIYNLNKNNNTVYELHYPLCVKIFDFDIAYYFGNKKTTNFNMNPILRNVNNISQIKMILNKFIYYLSVLEEEYELNEIEKLLYSEFMHKIYNILLKTTKFKLYFIDKDKEPIEINYDNKIDTMKKIFEIIKTQIDVEAFTDKSFDNNFNNLDTIIDSIYNDKMFKSINKKRNNTNEYYYMTYKMFDNNGIFINSERDKFIYKN